MPTWRDSDVFTPLERDVMAYAEAMSVTPLEVTDEMVASLHDRLGSKALVELTEVISLENLRSRTNAAMGLTSQVVMFSDGGGLRQAALRPIHGPDKVVRWMVGVFARFAGQASFDLAWLNGQPALRLFGDGVLDTVATVRVEDGLVTALYLVRNPEKLSRAEGSAAALTR